MGRDAKRAWTVLVYLAGDNSLDRAAIGDLAELKAVGDGPDVAVVAQVDRADGRGSTKRYVLRAGTPLARDVVADLGETNTGDPRVLGDFLAWGLRAFPARRTMAVVWNHGAGWDDHDVYGDRRRGEVPARRRPLFAPLPATACPTGCVGRGIAFDDDARDFLDTHELAGVLARVTRAAGRPFDVLGMDACLMSMLEVAYPLRDAARVLVASEELEPEDGWPYAAILSDLARAPAMGARTLAATIVDRYLASYRARDNVTLAALDLARTGAVVDAVDALARALLAALGRAATRAAVVAACAAAQRYDTPSYVDLGDLCAHLARGPAGPAVAAAAAAVERARARCVVRQGTKGPAVARSTGLSIHAPDDGADAVYRRLDLARATRWPAFLDAYARAAGYGARRTSRNPSTW